MPQFQHASFIPKKPLTRTAPTVTRSKKKVGGLSSVSVIIFALTVIASGGVFAYEKVQENEIEAKKVLLEQESARLQTELNFVEEVTDINERIELTKDILDMHLTNSVVLELLQDITLKTVQFTSFVFKSDITTIDLEGVSQSFASLALQVNSFRENDSFQSVEVSNIGLDERGGIGFSIKAILKPEVMRYVNQFNSLSSNLESENLN